MSIPKPTDLPVWAVTGDKTTPSIPEQQAGWSLNEPPLFDWMNWHQNLVYNWVKYLDDMVPAQANQGYTYKTPANGQVMISPSSGACTVISGSWVTPAAQERFIKISNVGSFLGYIDIGSLFLTSSNIAALNVTITSISILTKWVSGNYSITLEKFGSIAPNLLPSNPSIILGLDATTGKTTHPTNWQEFVIIPSELLDPSWIYRVVLSGNTLVADGDIQIHSITINYTKDRVE